MEFADIAFQFQFSHSILLGAPAIQMATVQRCSCNVRPSGSEILTHQRMSTVIHWWSKPSSICSSRRVQEYFRNAWLRKKCETTEFREQDLWEVSRENRAAEKGFKSGEIRRELCERVSGTRTDRVSANSHRWNQVWQKCWPTSVLRKITQSVKNNKTYCFSTHNGPFGWCATCKVRNLSSRVDSIDPFSEKPRRGREVFAREARSKRQETPKTLMKWPGQMPLRYWISFCQNSVFWKPRGGVFATSHAKLRKPASSTLCARYKSVSQIPQPKIRLVNIQVTLSFELF